MKLLLDTCTFLWVISDAKELSRNAKTLVIDPENKVYLSTISVWELLVKYHAGRLVLPDPPEQFIIKQRQQHQIEPLPLHEGAIEHLLKLPEYHKDPFDRMLICQAITHGLTVLTPDKEIRQYPVTTVW
jgi:PIN domain nuclease of toxin-antitoxin system